LAEIRIRPAEPADASVILAMVRELAVYEREPLTSVEAREEDFLRDCFGPARRCAVLIGEVGARVQGFALFFHNYSTWVGRAGIHVEDLFVRDGARGLGLGRRLLAAVAQIAVERGCRRLDLAVLDWNPARKLYEQLGFTPQSQWVPYRLAAKDIAKLAAEAGN
jgi:GNAT superfamily N-acetyltransferase